MLKMKINALLILLFSLVCCSMDAQDYLPSDTIFDIEGNAYRTVIIGKQTWMAENLRTSKYNDSTDIFYKSVKTLQKNIPYFYWYAADAEKYKYPYGGLYNWYAVNTGKLCPSGWHVPDEAEWDYLAIFLGGSKEAGGKMKDIGTTYWKSPNMKASNASGFTALPGGICQRTFYYMGKMGFWWSSTDGGDTVTWYRFIKNDSSSLYKNYFGKKFGLSVRCIKD